MFDVTFDIMVCMVAGLCAILLFTGNGKFLLTAFRGKANKGKPLPYEEKKLSIGTGILCLAILLAELVIIFFAETAPIAVILAMLAVLAAFVAVFRYLKKYARVKIEPDHTISDKIKDLSRKNKR